MSARSRSRSREKTKTPSQRSSSSSSSMAHVVDPAAMKAAGVDLDKNQYTVFVHFRGSW